MSLPKSLSVSAWLASILAACSGGGDSLRIVVSKDSRTCTVESSDLPCSDVAAYVREEMSKPPSTYIMVSSSTGNPASIEDIRRVMGYLKSAGYSKVTTLNATIIKAPE